MNPPRALHRSGRDGELHIDWGNGDVQRIAFARLRGACPCSQCRAARLQGRIALVAADIGLVALTPQGYGVQLVFDDGHERGIYPWDYLRRLG